MDRAIVSAITAMLLLWVGAVAYASSQLVVNNWRLFTTWCRQDRDTRVRLALWLAIPLMKVGILSFAGHALWTLTMGDRVSDLAIIRGLIVAPMLLTAAILMMFWIADRLYGAEKGDRLWRRLMWAGVVLGAGMLVASWWLG